MPSFKPKTNKKIKVSKRNATTLDGKHNEFLTEFVNDEYEQIPKLKQEKHSLKLKLEAEKNIDIRMELSDRINEINQTIRA